jgi:antirestriction protein ArdC
MTFKQSLELGGCVRKGEKSEKVIFYKTLIKEAETEDDDDRVIPMARAYSVFNVEQIDGLPEHYYTKSEPLAPIGDRNADLDAWIANTGADIRHGGAKAFYQPTNDFIQMPNFEAFSSVEAYYATHLHELTHWTKKGNRLDRDLGRKQWGDEGYAREELVAEIGSAFLCADLNVSNVIRDDHSSYIDAWIKVLKGDKRAIFQAASMATKAAEYLHSLQVKEESKAA